MAAASKEGVVARIVAATGQGAVGAVVGAILSAFSEPIVNRVLVKRVPLKQAIDEVNFEAIHRFFLTTLPTNFVKFPFFEAVNMIMQFVDVSPALRGTVTGTIFTTSTLPITNYRYRKSMGLPVELGLLYQAYFPTVLRDIMYGIVRNNVTTMLINRNPDFAKTDGGRFTNMFLTVLAACVLSAPGNEFRGYCLQPKGKEKPFKDFFQPQNFVRSTTIGGIIMATSLGAGAYVTPKVQNLTSEFRAYLERNPLAKCIIGLYVIHQILAMRRKAAGEGDDKRSGLCG